MYQVLPLCASVGMLHYPAKNYVGLTKQKSVKIIRVNISAVALR